MSLASYDVFLNLMEVLAFLCSPLYVREQRKLITLVEPENESVLPCFHYQIL